MKTRKMPAGRVALTAAFVVLALALVPAALAGKGTGGGGGKGGGGGSTGSTGGSSSIALAPLVYDANGNGLPNYGDVVVFSVSTTATDQPYVNLQCSQNGVQVLNSWNGYFAAALNSSWNFGLGSGAWQGGAADCTAYLEKATSKGWSKLASTSFHVDA